MNADALKAIPIWGWLSMLATAGVVFLVYHQYATNEADTEWNPDMQPPQMLSPAAISMIGNIKHYSQHKRGDSMPLRVKMWPDNLVRDPNSIIGEF